MVSAAMIRSTRSSESINCRLSLSAGVLLGVLGARSLGAWSATGAHLRPQEKGSSVPGEASQDVRTRWFICGSGDEQLVRQICARQKKCCDDHGKMKCMSARCFCFDRGGIVPRDGRPSPSRHVSFVTAFRKAKERSYVVRGYVEHEGSPSTCVPQAERRRKGRCDDTSRRARSAGDYTT